MVTSQGEPVKKLSKLGRHGPNNGNKMTSEPVYTGERESVRAGAC